MRFSRILIILAIVSVVGGQGVWPAVAQDDELTATFVSSDPDEQLSFSYPAAWVLDDLIPGMVLLGNTESALGMLTDEAGEFVFADDEVLILFLAPSMLEMIFLDTTEINSLEDVAAFFMQDSTDLSRPEHTFIAGYPALSVSENTSPSSDLYVIDFDGKFALAWVMNLDNARRHEATVHAILNTLALNADVTATTPATPPAEAEFRETYTSPNGRTTIDLSAGWYWAEITSQRWVLIGDFPSVSAMAERFQTGETGQVDTIDQTWLVVMLPEALSTLVQPSATQVGDPLSVVYNVILETIVAPRFDDTVDLRALENRPTTLAGYPALFGESSELFQIVIDFDGDYLAIFGQFGSGANARADALDIIDSIQYSAP